MRIVRVAEDLHDLDEKLLTLGHSRSELFFKIVDAKVNALYPGPLSKYNLLDKGADAMDDFLKVQQIHAILPENSAVPVAIVAVGNALNVVGYLSERIYGVTLVQRLNEAIVSKAAGASEADEYLALLDSTRTAVSRLHAQGLSHGDLGENNVMVTQYGAIKLIDPMHSTDESQGIIRDVEALEIMARKARRL